MRFNKTLVKLDLSNNGLVSPVANYLVDALRVNIFISEVNFHGNTLDDEFAFEVAQLLQHNSVLYKLDISANPISPQGANAILVAISEYNDTLGDLGDLEQSSYMGVRTREELRQAIKLNNSSADKRIAKIEDRVAGTKTNHPDASALPDDDDSKVVGSAA